MENLSPRFPRSYAEDHRNENAVRTYIRSGMRMDEARHAQRYPGAAKPKLR